MKTPKPKPTTSMLRLLAPFVVVMLAFVGFPLLLVGTGAAGMALWGNSWWAPFLISPIVICEFIAGIALFCWLGPRTARWAGI